MTPLVSIFGVFWSLGIENNVEKTGANAILPLNSRISRESK